MAAEGEGPFRGLSPLYKPDVIGHLAAQSSVFGANQAQYLIFNSNVDQTVKCFRIH